MRFWITKNSELPVREQLVRQVLLGILSEDLLAGQKLPSVRALARRHNIHPNTVSAAYHDLLQRGWLELRRGSGLYVRKSGSADEDLTDMLGTQLAELLRVAGTLGHEPEQVLHRLERMVRPINYERILVAEDEPEMRRILQVELGEQFAGRVEGSSLAEIAAASASGSCVVVALATRLPQVRRVLPAGRFCIALRLRSVRGSLEGQSRPAPNTLVSIVSASPEIRFWARAVLLSVGLEPDGLQEIDATVDGWRERLGLNSLIVTDVAAAGELPTGCMAKVFRVIADSSIAELKQLCGRA